MESQETEDRGEQPIYDIFKNPSQHQVKPKKANRTPKRKINESEADGEEITRELRPRTPSGQVLSSSVGEIKTLLFTSEKKQAKRRPSDYTFNPFKAAIDHGQQSPIDLEIPLVTPISGNQTTSNVRASINMFNTECKQTPVNMSEEAIMENEEEDNQTAPHQSNTQTSDNNSQVVAKYIKEALTANQHTTKETDAPITMDIRTVIQMLAELRIELKSDIVKEVKQEISDLKVALLGDGKSTPAFNQKETQTELASVRARVQVCEAKERMMVDTMAGMADTIKELKEKMEAIEMASVKKTLIISGLEVDEKEQETLQAPVGGFLPGENGPDYTDRRFLQYWICDAERCCGDPVIVSTEKSSVPKH